jgi:hypothetical protein
MAPTVLVKRDNVFEPPPVSKLSWTGVKKAANTSPHQPPPQSKPRLLSDSIHVPGRGRFNDPSGATSSAANEAEQYRLRSVALTQLHRDTRNEYYDCQERCWKVNVEAERARDKIREAGGNYEHQASIRGTMCCAATDLTQVRLAVSLARLML